MSNTDTIADTGKNLPQLDYENYDVWAPRMMYQLEKDDVWWTIEQVPEEPVALDPMASFVKLGSTPTVAKYKLKWNLDSKKAVRGIMANCDPTRYEEVNVMVENEGLSTAAVWNRLKETYKKKNNAANARMWSELVRITIPTGASYKESKEAFDSFSRLANRIQNTQLSMKDILAILCIRLGTANFQSVVDVLNMREDITFKTIIESCLTTALGREENTVESKALVGRQKKDNKRKHSNPTGNTSKSSKSSITDGTKCSHCDKSGHKAEGCWKKFPEKKPDWMKAKDEEKTKKKKLRVSSD